MMVCTQRSMLRRYMLGRREKLGDDWVELQLEDAEAMRKEYEDSMDRNWRNFIGVAAGVPKIPKEGVKPRKRKAVIEEEEEEEVNR
jgi:hypothetical protein